MCPFYLYSDRQSLCGLHPDGLMCPSLHERKALCGDCFRDCRYYAAANQPLKQEPAEAHSRFHLYIAG